MPKGDFLTIVDFPSLFVFKPCEALGNRSPWSSIRTEFFFYRDRIHKASLVFNFNNLSQKSIRFHMEARKPFHEQGEVCFFKP
ncbi:hypothetical protein IC582_007496 [Cucumis melo]